MKQFIVRKTKSKLAYTPDLCHIAYEDIMKSIRNLCFVVYFRPGDVS
jgi:hypothetical protein